MKAILAAITAMVIMTAAAPYTLDQFGFSAAVAGSGTAVRLD